MRSWCISCEWGIVILGVSRRSYLSSILGDYIAQPSKKMVGHLFNHDIGIRLLSHAFGIGLIIASLRGIEMRGLNNADAVVASTHLCGMCPDITMRVVDLTMDVVSGQGDKSFRRPLVQWLRVYMHRADTQCALLAGCMHSLL